VEDGGSGSVTQSHWNWGYNSTHLGEELLVLGVFPAVASIPLQNIAHGPLIHCLGSRGFGSGFILRRITRFFAHFGFTL